LEEAPMIADELVTQVRRLLAAGIYNQREIARMTGVSRSTVCSIATGKRPDYRREPPAPREEIDGPSGPPQRCPGCGGMVYAPCRLCQMRAFDAGKPRAEIAGRPSEPEEPLRLQLKEEHRLRYEEVRARREAQEALTPCDTD
jgi:hypothetical protein